MDPHTTHKLEKEHIVYVAHKTVPMVIHTIKEMLDGCLSIDPQARVVVLMMIPDLMMGIAVPAERIYRTILVAHAKSRNVSNCIVNVLHRVTRVVVHVDVLPVRIYQNTKWRGARQFIQS
jgi:hypothetical protein